MQVRTKALDLDGAKFTIGALTVRQVREFFGEGKETNVMTVVCRSLNNAREMQPEAARGPEWTFERMQEETDDATFGKLRDAVIEFNGVTLKKEGEAPASESISSSSAAE
jgi:hypothetical protein